MTEVEQLKNQIQNQLNGISKHELRLVQKIIDRLEEVEQCLKHNEPSLTRGNDAIFFKNEIDLKSLPSAPKGEHLQGLVGKAITLLEDLEGQLPKS